MTVFPMLNAGTAGRRGVFQHGARQAHRREPWNLSDTSAPAAVEAERHEASKFTLAVVMAGIFAFFIAGIASAFIYAKDTNPRRVRTRKRRPHGKRAGRDHRFRAAVPNNEPFSRIFWTSRPQRAPDSRSCTHAEEPKAMQALTLMIVYALTTITLQFCGF